MSRKTVRAALVAGGVVVVLAFVMVWFYFYAQPISLEETRTRLVRGGFSTELGSSASFYKGAVWGPSADGAVVYQEVTVLMGNTGVSSVRGEAFLTEGGKRKWDSEPVAEFDYSPSAGVRVTKTRAGVPQPVLDRARREFEQMTAALNRR